MTINELDPKMMSLFDFKLRKGDMKRIEIIQASIECLATIGIDNTTYDAVAKKVGTTRAHIAYYFTDKDQIYIASIKYILASFQQTILEHLSEKNLNGKELLEEYVEAVFLWAKNYPDQLTVMILLYYLCRFREDMVELNHQIRKAGYERVYYILTSKMSKKLNEKKATVIARALINLISGSMIDATTTKSMTLDEAKDLTIATLRLLLE